MKVFIFTTGSINTSPLAGKASIMMDVVEGKMLISKFYFDSGFGVDEDELGLFDGDELKYPDAEQFDARIAGIDFFENRDDDTRELPRHIRQIEGSNIFFYYRLPDDNKDDEIYIKFIQLLCADVFKIIGEKEEGVDLHLILHQGDCKSIAGADKKIDSNDGFGLKLKNAIRRQSNRVLNDLTIWTFSHTDHGVHGDIILNRSIVEKEGDLGEILLSSLNLLCSGDTQELAGMVSKQVTDTGTLYYEVDLDEDGASAVDNKAFIPKLVRWQLSGSCTKSDSANDIAKVDFHKGNFEHARPLLICGEKKLKDFKKERRRNYLDSSIWCRYANTDEEKNAVIESFNRYEALGLYNSSNAKESLEFWARMAGNSELREFGGHEENVSPYLFHSETEMEIKSAKILEKLKGVKEDRLLEWRFLLIDDHARGPLGGNGCPASKCQVICDILKDDFVIRCGYTCKCDKGKGNPGTAGSKGCDRKFFKNIDNPPNPKGTITIECAGGINEARQLIFSKRYDIILLDYLLGYLDGEGKEVRQEIEDLDGSRQIFYIDENNKRFKEADSKPESWQRDYSYKLLKEISLIFDTGINKDNEDNKDAKELAGKVSKYEPGWKKAIGINKHFWFYHISAFITATSQRLLEQGMAYNTSYWHMSRGASPITAPQLFKYTLLDFMLYQIKKITKLPQSLSDSDNKKINTITLPDLLRLVYCQGDVKHADKKNITEIREKADFLFGSVLELRAKYKVLKDDVLFAGIGAESQRGHTEKGSPLVKVMFDDIENYNDGFWEHLIHLIYLTAYGTVREWPQMWDEYLFLKDSIADKEITGAIENYIIGLK